MPFLKEADLVVGREVVVFSPWHWQFGWIGTIWEVHHDTAPLSISVSFHGAIYCLDWMDLALA